MTRRIDEISRRIDTVIQDNRVTIAFTFPIIGAILLIASAENMLPDTFAFHPVLLLLGILVIRLPILAGILPVLNHRVLVVLGVLVVYTYSIEYIGVTTGIPYGEFEYGIGFGPMVGGIPVMLPMLFVPLALNAYLLVRLTYARNVIRPHVSVTALCAAIMTLIAIDLVLDPGAVALGFWSFTGGGSYYGVPWTNYAGWVLSASVAIILVHLAFAGSQLIDRSHQCEFILDDLVSFTILWGLINFYYANVIPTALALVLLGWLWWIGRVDAIPGFQHDTRGLVKSD